MNDDEIRRWRDRLIGLGYKRGPSMSFVGGTIWDADGVYFDIANCPVSHLPNVPPQVKPGWISFVIVGPMHKTPLEYSEDLPGYRVALCRALPPEENMPEQLKAGMLMRGFWQIAFQPWSEYKAQQESGEKAA